MGRRKGFKHSEETKRKISQRHKGKPRPQQSGEKHNMWLGDDVGYQGIHLWLRRFPKTKCEFCGCSEKLEYSLKRGFKHERNFDNYQILCVPCHRKYDAREPWNKGMRKKRKDLICGFCNTLFTPKRNKQRFCSSICASRNNIKKTPSHLLELNKH